MKNIWKKATKIIPGGNTLISKRPNLWLPETWPTHFVKSNNIEITDSSGKKYDDFLFAVGTNPLGYANTKINSNIIKAIKKGSMSSLNAIEEYTFAEKILDANKWANMAKFTRSGGEANTIAIRIARAASNKDNVAFCGYHGWHDWYVSSNIVKKNSLDDHLISGVDTAGVPEALNKTIFSFRYNDYKRIEHLVRCNNIGTIIMEVKRYLGGNLGLLNLFLLFAMLEVFVGPLFVIIPFYVSDVLFLDKSWYGYFMGSLTGGILLGNSASILLKFSRKSTGKIVVLLLFIFGLSFVFLGPLSSVVLVIIDLLVMGFCVGFITVMVVSSIQRNTENYIRGRVIGCLYTVAMTLGAFSVGMSGVIADLVANNVRMIFYAFGALILIVPLVFLNSRGFSLLNKSD